MRGKKTFLGFVALLVLFVFLIIFPRSVIKSYHYLSIDADIAVNADSTLTVAETLREEFHGPFHQSTRHIPLKNLTAIDEISVVDVDTHQAFLYSPTKLDKMDPKSWGKYTTYIQDGECFIEWYYNIADTVHSWTIFYKVEGGVDLYNNHAELNWNVFTGYHVPIDESSVLVHLPATMLPEALAILVSTPRGTVPGSIIDGSTLKAARTHIPATEPFSILVTFPKELLK